MKRLFGLIGYPLSHSFSKRYFSEKFQLEGFPDYEYELYPIPEIGSLPDLLKEHPILEGINVTIPYKEQVIPYLHELSPVVEEIGACNCIRIRNGKLTGFNTDVIGFEQTLSRKLMPHHRHALVLGTGGAAKAVHYVLRQKSISFLQIGRTQRGEILDYSAVTPELLSKHTLIINTTPMGMYPNVDEAPDLPYESLTPEHYLYDLVYNPDKTLFLQKGEEQGAAIENGADMLVIQADASWDIWNS
jgi:shikimate dehydrogenase